MKAVEKTGGRTGGQEKGGFEAMDRFVMDSFLQNVKCPPTGATEKEVEK